MVTQVKQGPKGHKDLTFPTPTTHATTLSPSQRVMSRPLANLRRSRCNFASALLSSGQLFLLPGEIDKSLHIDGKIDVLRAGKTRRILCVFPNNKVRKICKNIGRKRLSGHNGAGIDLTLVIGGTRCASFLRLPRVAGMRCPLKGCRRTRPKTKGRTTGDVFQNKRSLKKDGPPVQ